MWNIAFPSLVAPQTTVSKYLRYLICTQTYLSFFRLSTTGFRTIELVPFLPALFFQLGNMLNLQLFLCILEYYKYILLYYALCVPIFLYLRKTAKSRWLWYRHRQIDLCQFVINLILSQCWSTTTAFCVSWLWYRLK